MQKILHLFLIYKGDSMRLNLRLKLLILMAVTIVVTLIVNSYFHYTNVLQEYHKSAFVSTNNDYKTITYKINSFSQNLINLSNQIVNDNNIKSITNLISNYENKNDYNAIIFNEEKKRLLNLISQQIKSKKNISFSVFDKDLNPIIFNRNKDGKVLNGIISYNEKTEFINIKTGEASDIPYFMSIKKNSDKVDIRLDKNGFGLVYVQKIYLDNKLVGYLRIKEVFTKSTINLFVDNLNNKFSFLTKDFLLGNFFDIDKEYIKEHSILVTDVHSIDDINENERYSFHMHYMKALDDEKLYLISTFDKDKLDSKIDLLKKNLILAILISFIISFIISIYFFKVTILNPISKLSNGMQNLKKQKYNIIKLDTNDEFSDIADEFNVLTKNLKDSFSKIEESKSFIKNIIDTAPVRVFWKDKDNKYIGANKLFLHDADLEDESEIIGKTDWELKWKSQAQSYIDDDNFVMNSKKEKLKFEETQSFANNIVINLITSKVPLINKNGDVIGVLGIYDDVTEQRTIEKMLHQREQQIAEQTKMASMGEMIGNIAHQWRQPLSVISTASSGLQLEKENDILSDEQFNKYCEAINRNAQYLSKTIDDFKNFIKGDRLKKVFNLSENIHSSLNLVDGSIKKYDISLILNFDDKLEIDGYSNELTQCFINIFNNSKDAFNESIDNTEYKLLFISTSKVDDKVIITIKDNAGGIPNDILPKIYEPYFTTKHMSQGTGLGLHMTYNMIVDGMGGGIDIHNTNFEYQGKKYNGTEVIISLPM